MKPFSPPVERFIQDLPKVELHVHLEGSMSPPVFLRLVEKHGIPGLPRTPEEVAAHYEFRDFARFIEVYVASVRVLRDEEDFALLTVDAAQRLAAQNVRYAEVHISLYNHLSRGIPAAVVFAGVEHGRREAERRHGIRLRWIPDFPGDYGAEAGEQTLDAVLADGPPSVVGFGVGGVEVDRAPFREVYDRARAAGLHSLPHAGETGGPQNVWTALTLLGAERIGHGIGSMADPRLVDHLGSERIPLDVAPTSNVRTRAVADIAEHPLPRMLEAGLVVTLNSDDPPMFGTDLVNEYRTAYALGLDLPDLALLARNGVAASYLDAAAKRELAAQVDAVLAAARRG